MKRMLMIATVPSMIGQFNMNNIVILLKLGYEVDIACNWNDKSVWTNEKTNSLKKRLDDLGVRYYQIDYARSLFNIKKHILSYKQTLRLLICNNYNFVHCHTPIASAITRLVCKKTETKCIYTAHGFHFYRGAPIINWVIFYPIEKWLSKYTDILITINKEDYFRARNNFNMKKIVYIPGVGIDINKIIRNKCDEETIRDSLHIPKNNKIVISVGELSKRKNHKLVINALKNVKNVTYIICGMGYLKDYLSNLSKKQNVDLRLLGYRTDVINLIKISDVFVFPSLQEGLPVALMEAMACGVPCLASNIRGNIDLLDDCKDMCVFNSKKELTVKIINILSKNKQFIEYKQINNFSIDKINKSLIDVYNYFD